MHVDVEYERDCLASNEGNGEVNRRISMRTHHVIFALVACLGVSIGLVGVAQAGTLVGVTQCCPNQFVVVDPSTGALNPLSIVGDITVGFPAGASALDSDTHRFFLIRIQSGLPHLIAINTLTGAVDESPPLSPSLFALGFDSVAVPAQLVEIDIKPGSDPNSINCRMNGVIPVAILTTSDFDATTVDPSTVGFGPAAALRTHRRAHIQDADGDGDMDMVLHFRQQDTGIASGDEEACLTGETTDGTAIEGCDAITDSRII